MVSPSLDSAIETAWYAAEDARLGREDLRWSSKPGDPEREKRLRDLLAMLTAAMEPIRSALGKLAWEPVPARLEKKLRDASQALQYERKQLKKMRR